MRTRLILNATLACAALVAAPVVSIPLAAAAPRPVEPEVSLVDLPEDGTATTAVDVPEGTAVMGVTWESEAPGEAAPTVEIRTLRDGTWGDWSTLHAAGDGPDPGSAEAARAERAGAVQATEPVEVIGVEKVEVRASNVAGVDNLEAALVDPGESPADAAAGATAGPLGTADAAVAKPAVVSRAQWGVDESLRSCTPSEAESLKGVLVNHTANTNNYTRDQAPGLVRSIYAYHTKVNKWCDMGYNALVDRYGTIYEGRYGGLDRNIIGAHGGGFNTGTWGVSVIGNYDEVALQTAAQASLERLLAWRLGVAGLDPTGTMRLVSAGSTRYTKGTAITLPVIAAHRDVSLTACPGRHIYDKLGTIRANVDRLAGAAPAPTTTSTSATTHTVVSGDTLAKIASRYGTTVDALQTANDLTGTLIRVGQVLRVPPSEFTDVPNAHSFYTEIRWLADGGITLGVGDGSVFDTRSPVQRQHMAAFLYRLAGSPAYTPPARAQFSDVPRDHNFYKEISWLAAKGITRGVGGGRFGATDPVQRQQMAGFLYRLSGERFTPTRQQFTDVSPSLSLYTAVSWLAARGITEGVGGHRFDPLGPVQRQHMAAFLYRYDQR